MIGTHYVGLVTGTCLAEIGHDVVCIDSVEAEAHALESGKSPIYEPDLNHASASSHLVKSTVPVDICSG